MFRARLSLISVSLLFIACNDTAIEPSQSLVGAMELPSAQVLDRETFYIQRGAGAYGGDVLSYEWRPDDSLTVTHTFSNLGPSESVRGKETLLISPEAALQARQLLRRVRPAEFETPENYGEKYPTRPIGCERKGPHDFGEVSVAFTDEGQGSGVEDDQIRVFELPYPGSCNTPAAVEARKVIQHVLRLLPRSKVAADFNRTT
jgi:hypothetical protein